MSRVSEIMDSMEYGPSVEDSSAARDWLKARAPFCHFIARFLGGMFSKSYMILRLFSFPSATSESTLR